MNRFISFLLLSTVLLLISACGKRQIQEGQNTLLPSEKPVSDIETLPTPTFPDIDDEGQRIRCRYR